MSTNNLVHLCSTITEQERTNFYLFPCLTAAFLLFTRNTSAKKYILSYLLIHYDLIKNKEGGGQGHLGQGLLGGYII